MSHTLLARRAVLFAPFLAVGACAAPGGTLPRPEAGSLVLGQLTVAEALARFGPPQRRSKQVIEATAANRNARSGTVENLTYLYAPSGSNDRLVRGAFRRLTLAFVDDRLTGYAYVSNFIADNISFDERKLPSFAEGKTTRADILRELGRPSGESVYPHGAANRRSALFYSYLSFKRSADYSGTTVESTNMSMRFFFDSTDRLSGTYKTDQSITAGAGDRV
ncbi:MAG: hypothetical protein JSR47_21800 [Proteobacteria bacterium]|nr:hypothetical protein [Pseudomonadota bacterium]